MSNGRSVRGLARGRLSDLRLLVGRAGLTRANRDEIAAFARSIVDSPEYDVEARDAAARLLEVVE